MCIKKNRNNIKEDELPMPKHDVKDTLFAFIIRKKKYLLELYKSIHPEDTDVREDEVELVNIAPLFYPSLMNDCSFLVRNRLLVLIEAQSTWTENIKHRLMEYYVQMYKMIIPEFDKRKFHGADINMPDFEFNVFNTGSQRVDKQLYITENRPGADMDFRRPYIPVNVYTRYNISGFAKQFFDFVHLYDKLSREIGRDHRAVEETIKRCLEENILCELLSEHLYEVEKFMEDYNAELIKIWVDDTIREEIDSQKETLLAQGEARGKAEGIAVGKAEGIAVGKAEGISIGRAEGYMKILTNLMNSDLSPEVRDKVLEIINSGN